MNKFVVVSAFALTLSTVALAAPKKAADVSPAPEASVREEALRENQSLDQRAYKKTIQASEAQQANVSSFLKLQDPTPELRDRPWLYTFAFKLQSMQPRGTGEVTGATFDLSSYGTGVMPSLEFGFLVDTLQAPAFTWFTGASAHIGYMSQSTDLLSPSGYNYKSTRLNTALISLIWNNRFQLAAAPKWSVMANPEYGIVNHTQTNMTTSLANFAQQNRYWGLGLGAEYAVSNTWAVLAQYAYRNASAQNEAISDVQTNNVEIGTQVTW